MTRRPRAIVSWSSGKDSAWWRPLEALAEILHPELLQFGLEGSAWERL